MQRARYLITIIIALKSILLFSQDLPPKQAYPYDVKQIHSGHSLTDPLFYPHWPGQYVNLMTTLRGNWAGDDIGKSTIPGSPMRYRWDNPTNAPDARLNINKFELLCITEVATLCIEGENTATWYQECIRDQKAYLSLFANNAWENGNDGQGAATLLWTNWVSIDGSNGPFRQMLDKSGGEWERMQDYANENRPAGAPPIYIIPGHKMMARLYDDVQAGKVPGITQFSQFFGDNIHVNELGAYAIAMIHYACIYNKNPLGLPNNLINNPPAGTPMPSLALAEYLQKMIWEVVTTYPRTGIKDTSVKSEDTQVNDNCVYPNPAINTLVICQNENSFKQSKVSIFNAFGKLKMVSDQLEIDVSQLTSGMYYALIGDKVVKFVKL